MIFNRQNKYLILNSSNAENYKWSIPNLNLSSKSEIALISVQSAFINSNLNFIYCPSILNNNYESSLNTPPLIYCGIGYDILNITKNNYYGINGANLNEIELKLFSSPPLNNFSYPELDGLKPNLWLKFDTGAITTNSGTDNITITNINNTTNAGVSVRGNNSLELNGTNQYLTGTGANLSNNGSFSISIWFYPKTLSAVAYNIIFQFYKSGGSFWFNYPNNYKYEFGMPGLAITTTSTFANDLNNWVHFVFTYNITNKQVLFYRNGVLLATSANVVSAGMVGYVNTNFSIGATNTSANFFNGNLDDMRTYQFVLTQEQINTIYGSRQTYPIIKNESYKLPSPTDNDLNIDLNPVLWYKFDDSTNLGLDTMGKLNLVAYGNLPTYETIAIRGSGSGKFIVGQSLRSNYDWSDFGDEITICFWLKINALTASNETIIINTSDNSKLWIQRNSLTSNFGLRILGSGTITTHFVGKFVADSIWKHYTIIIKNLSGAVKLNSYFNGVFNATTTSGTWDKTNLTTLALGYTGLTTLMNLDDVRFYNKILTQEEITRIYNGDKIDYTILTIEPVIGQDLTPNIWLKFETGALLTNDGTDNTSIINSGTAINANISVRGNNSASFNGTNQYLTNSGSYPLLEISGNSWSVSAWIYSKSSTTNGAIINFGNANIAFQTLIGGFNLTKYYISDNNSTALSDNFAGDVNNWVHIVFIFNSQTLERSIYRNGVKLTLTNPTAGGLSTVLTRFSIAAANSIGNFHNGYIDDLRIYTRKVLSQAQINEIYAGNTFYNLPTNFNKYSTINDHLNLNLNIKDL